MTKESGGFLRKVVRFVANPTTDWNELDTPSAEAAESDYAKTEIKAMIERKRRNDFVRKRELDMLRKIRREGLNQDSALAFSGVSNFEPDSRPQTGTRSDVAVKAKIDEIELQMVGAGARPPGAMPLQPAARPSGPGALTDIGTTAPNTLTSPATLPYTEDLPRVTQATGRNSSARMPLHAAATQPSVLAVTRPQSLDLDLDVQVREVTHDPELDEAVIAFANADFDQCERALLDLVHPGAPRHDERETWLVLFDLYRALDLPQKFEQLGIAYAQKFGVSPPQWYSLPQKVAAFLAGQTAGASGTTGPATLPDLSPAADGELVVLTNDRHADTSEGQTQPRPLEGWVAPAVLDQDAVAALRIQVLQMPRPWTMDWSKVHKVTPEGAAQLTHLMRLWSREPQELVWTGVEGLLGLLADFTPTGNKDVDPALWMLRLEVLRLCNRPVQFDEVAIDYCVTYELSPPSWENAACRVRLHADSVSPHTRPLSHVSEVTTTFVESQLHDEIELVQMATLNLSGQLVGDIGQTLSRLDDQLGASLTLHIDCEHLLRVDFIAAGDLLNWVLARRAEDREVVFKNPHRLVGLFFGAMGINEHAKVKLQGA